MQEHSKHTVGRRLHIAYNQCIVLFSKLCVAFLGFRGTTSDMPHYTFPLVAIATTSITVTPLSQTRWMNNMTRWYAI
jgi:hypothetical protein